MSEKPSLVKDLMADVNMGIFPCSSGYNQQCMYQKIGTRSSPTYLFCCGEKMASLCLAEKLLEKRRRKLKWREFLEKQREKGTLC